MNDVLDPESSVLGGPEPLGYQANIPDGWRKKQRWTAEQKRYRRRQRFYGKVCWRARATVKWLGWFFLLWFAVHWAIRSGAALWESLTYVPPPLVRLHVSLNSLTGERSKWAEGVGPEAKFYLQGMGMVKDGNGAEAVYRCAISPEYWREVSQNSFVDVPASKCQRFDP